MRCFFAGRQPRGPHITPEYPAADKETGNTSCTASSHGLSVRVIPDIRRAKAAYRQRNMCPEWYAVHLLLHRRKFYHVFLEACSH